VRCLGGLIVAITLTACAGPAASTGAASPGAPSPSPLSYPALAGSVPSRILEPGTYFVAAGSWSEVPLTLTVPAGWVAENYGRTISKHSGEPVEVGLNVYAITDIFSDACTGTEANRQKVGPTADDLIRALTEQRNGAVMSEPIPINIGGYPATRVDLSVSPELDLTTCRPPGPVGIQIWQAIGEKYFVLLADGGASLYVADVGGERLVLTAQHWNASSPEDIAEMEAIVASIDIVE
jgi:hypothetical protein